MTAQDALFENEKPRYCLDTNVVVSFLKGTDDEYYGVDIFGEQWALIERLIASGVIVSPRQVERELAKWQTSSSTIQAWVKDHHYMFKDVETVAQLQVAKRIVSSYPVYAKTDNYLGDLEVMSLASALDVTVISLEGEAKDPSVRRPKIPNVCKEFGIDCVSVTGFLRREFQRARL
ncbi:DUF4411 family protein [Janibacter hoylei]